MALHVNPKAKQSDLEAEILKFWAGNNTFAKLVEQTKAGQPWVMVDGPVTANNRLGVHHGWGRTYKDIFQRFHAMRGRRCVWQNGFDCQGLWVEVEVEKELGISGPRDIEAVGMSKFADACRARVDRFADIITEQSKALGQWADWPNSYRTDSNNNILHIWNFLAKCNEGGLLYRGNRVMPWCTRCGTSLSHHEMADSYEDRQDTAIDFLCPLQDNRRQSFVVWTTTPWTVPANTALAVHPDLKYVLMAVSGGEVWMSEDCKNRGMQEIPILATKFGRELVGTEYVPPYKLPGVKYAVVPWDGIDKNTGSGIVHIAPAFGADDYALWKRLAKEPPVGQPYHGFHNFIPVDENGVYTHPELPLVKGQHWQKANGTVIADLSRRELLVAKNKITHRYPHCWRCKEPVIFRQSFQWFIAVTKVRDQLLAAAAKIDWKPAHVGLHMKNWLENMGDWCISRSRFWGLPLPFYPCDDCHHVTVVGSFEELAVLAGQFLDGNVHRPHIDAYAVKCRHCGKPTARVKAVGDCWLDAGVVPFSAFDYDVNGRHPNYPFDFAVEMREQVRLWFYSTLVMGVVLEGEAPFKTVMTYDEMRDEKGERFSKTKGNAPSLDKIVGEYGADVLRYALAVAPTDQIFQFSDGCLKKAKKTLNTLWNSVAYFAQNASLETMNLAGSFDLSDRLDCWIIVRLKELVGGVAAALESYDAQRAVFDIEYFINDLSTWYIRLKRPVFVGESDGAKELTCRVLYKVFKTLAGVMAPLFPFTAEDLHQKVIVPVEGEKTEESVHLTAFPEPPELHPCDLAGGDVIEQMRAVQDVVQIALSIRNGAKYKVRQPLRKVVIENWPDVKPWQLKLIEQEANVLSARADEAIPNGAFQVTCREKMVYVNLELDEELRELGAVREFVRCVQERRKELGLVIADRIALFVVGEDSRWGVLNGHATEIRHKTNADSLVRFDTFGNGENYFEVDVMGGAVKVLAVKTKS